MAQNLLGCSAEQHGRSMLTRNSARNTRFIEISHEFHGVSDLMSLSHLYFCARPVWHKALGGSHLTYFILLTSHDPIFPQLHLSFRAWLATIAEAIVCIESQLTAVSTTFSTSACSTKHGLRVWFQHGRNLLEDKLIYILITLYIYIRISWEFETWIQHRNESIPGRKLSDWRMRKGQNTNPSVAPKERKNQKKTDNKMVGCKMLQDSKH